MLTMVIMFLAFLGVITMGCIKLTSAEQIRAALSKAHPKTCFPHPLADPKER